MINNDSASIVPEFDQQDTRDLCYGEAQHLAANVKVYTSQSLDFMSRFTLRKLDTKSVREYLDSTNYRAPPALVTQAAMLAMLAALEHLVEADLSKFEIAIRDATLAGLGSRKVYATCPNGLAAHVREDEWIHETFTSGSNLTARPTSP